jgi:uncharacterized protein YabN with tetrapyrrole methylase and pyrophosphatase domain
MRNKMKQSMENAFINAEHGDLVVRLSKPGHAILRSMTAEKAHLLHMAVGVASEAGELLDAVKKHVIYEMDLHDGSKGQSIFDNIVEEHGDLEFYLNGIREALNIHREFVLRRNIEKLEQRYGSSYSNEAAEERADKS